MVISPYFFFFLTVFFFAFFVFFAGIAISPPFCLLIVDITLMIKNVLFQKKKHMLICKGKKI